MNEVQMRVDFEKQICEPVGINLITGDYNSTKLVFTFDREDGTKLFKMKNPNDETIFAQEIINNEVVLVGETEQGEPASLFKSAGDYVIEIALYDDDSRLTSISSVLSVLQEQVVLDGGEEIVVYKPLFDQLIEDLNAAIAETNNLDIDVNKEEHTTTIELTKKDGTTKEVEILDGNDGQDGADGNDATINGVNTLTMVAGENVELEQDGDTLTISASGIGGTHDYTELENKPSINSVELNGNKTSADLGLANASDIPDLTNYVTNIDYANDGTGGVIKSRTTLGFNVDNSGRPYATSYSYNNYNSLGENAFVGKGTLENVITGKGLINNNVNDLTNYYNKTEVDSKVSSVYKYRGTVATYGDLPSQDLVIGDVYNVETDGSNYAWNGTIWDKLGGDIDLSGYQTKIDSSNKLSSDLVDDTNNTNKFVTTSEKSTWNAKYDKPSGGIPSTDMSSAVQTSLGKADTAVQDISGKQDVLVSGTNIKTINNESVLGSGNIAISGSIIANIHSNYTTDLSVASMQEIIDKMYNNNLTQVYISQNMTGYRTVDYCMASTENAIANTRTSYGITAVRISHNLLGTQLKFASQLYTVTVSWSDNVPTVTNVSKNGGMTTREFYTVGNTDSWTPNTNYSPTPKKYVDDAISGITIQYATMPTASSTNLGKIVQYTGTTTSSYTNGHFYQCVSDGAATPTYSWTEIQVQQSAGGGNVYYLSDNSSSNPLILDQVPLGIYIPSPSQSVFFVRGTSTSTSSRMINPAYGMYFAYIKQYSDANDGEAIVYSSYGNYEFSGGQYIATQRTLLKNNSHNTGLSTSTANTTYIDAVSLSGAQTINGVKTFSSLPQSSATPSNNNDLVNKSYVDSAISSAITDALGGSY